MGFDPLVIPGASWTLLYHIDDAGNIYGQVSGIAGFTYFVAEPVTPYVPACQLARDGTEVLPEPPAPPSTCPAGQVEAQEDEGIVCEDAPDNNNESPPTLPPGC